ETNPSHLKAIAVSGLIDDLYRGVEEIGGIPDAGFPALWAGLARPASEQSGNLPRYGGETSGGDPTCAANIATRPPRHALDEPILNRATTREAGVWRA